jgi:hypothetical protein
MHVIIKEQFGRLRDGDRLYYGSEFSELSGIQDQINSTTLADVILRNTEIERIQCNVFFSEQVLDEMDCNLRNKAVTSDGSNNNNDPSASTGGADIIKYSVPLLLIILVLILANAQSTASNEFEKKEKAEKPLLNEEEIEKGP